MKTTEGNKLIAEFMEYPYTFTEDDIEKWEIDQDNWFSAEDMRHHSSWDWLMPVVEKCTQVGWRDQDDGSEIFEYYCNVFLDNCGIFIGNHIDEAWTTVVEFIQWYNEQSIILTWYNKQNPVLTRSEFIFLDEENRFCHIEDGYTISIDEYHEIPSNSDDPLF